jgi:hypothetical protein
MDGAQGKAKEAGDQMARQGERAFNKGQQKF